MKLFKSNLFALAAAFAASLIMIGCNDQKPQDNGGPQLPDVTTATVLPGAVAMYMGDEYEVGVAHFMAAIYSDGLTFKDANWQFDGSGDFIWLDFLSPLPADERNIEIATGAYDAGGLEVDFKAFTFSRGEYDEQGITLGSFCATVVDGKEVHDIITDGTVWVSRTGNTYQFIVQVKTESGKEHLYKFENTLRIINFGVPVGPDPFEGKMAYADYRYYGDYYKAKFGNFMLELTTIPTNEFVAGYILGLDINDALATTQKDIKIIPGTYAFDKTKTFNKPMTFNEGFSEGGYIYGSYWVTMNSEGGVVAVDAVVGGEFTITDLGSGKYKVVATVEVDNGTTIETVDATFEGVIPITDATCLSTMDSDVQLDKFTQGMMVYRGNVEYTTNGAENWAIMLATEGIDLKTMTGTGDVMQLDINTEKDAKTELSFGSYSVIKSIENSSLKPMTYIMGFNDNQRGLIGTWYRKDLNYTAPAVTGLINIKKEGANYHINFEMRDDHHYSNNALGNKIDGSYIGPLTYIDATENLSTQTLAFAPFSAAPRAAVAVAVEGKRELSASDVRRVTSRR